MIPLLAKLPLTPSSSPAKPLKDRLAELQEQAWALAAISSFASDSALRRQLLQPHHKLVQRIVRLLASPAPSPSTINDESYTAAEAAAAKLIAPHAEVLHEATRTLRNLAVDASYESVRLEIARHEGIPVLLGLLARTHSALASRIDSHSTPHEAGGPVPGASLVGATAAAGKEALQAQIEQERQRLQASLPTPERPLESMNKKQRRHALKAQTILAELEAKTSQAQTEAAAPGNDNDTSLTGPSEGTQAPGVSGETELARRANEALSHDAQETFELCEMVENILTLIWLLAEASETLGLQLVETAPGLPGMLCVYLRWVSSDPQQGGIAQGSPYQAKLAQIARTAGNTLLVLADENAAFVRLLAGVEYSQEEIKALSKGARGRFASSSLGVGSGSSKGAAAPAVAAAEAKHAQVLAAPHVNRAEGQHSLASLLSCTTLIPEAPKGEDLPMVGILAAAVLRGVLATLPEPEALTAPRPQLGESVSLVQFEEEHVLPRISTLLSQSNLEEVSQGSDDAAELVLLALEVAAESMPFLARVLDEQREKEWDESMDGDDVMEGDASEEGGDADEDVIEAEVLDDVGPTSIGHSTGAKGASDKTEFSSSFLAKAFTGPVLLPALVGLATLPVTDEFTPESGLAGSRRRRLAVHALAALNNLLLALAEHSPPPPSQPVEAPEQAAHLAQVSAWVASTATKARIEELWRELFQTAAKVASVPQVAASDSAPSPAGQDGRKIFEHCLGCLWALARLSSGDLPLRLSAVGSSTGDQEVDVSTALQAAYHTAASDAVRVKAIGTIGCLARGPHVSDADNLTLGTFLVNVVKAVAAEPNTGSASGARRGGTSAEALVAALNAVMDVYADETRAYDHNYTAGKFSGALRASFARVRQAARGVDKRAHASLRAAADEAVGNLMAFVQYRDGLQRK